MTGRTVEVDRAQVLAYRAAAQGLHREADAVSDLAVLDLGVQEAMGHPASLAWAARLSEDVEVTPDSVAVGPGHRLALAWSLRGAPHVHRRADLDGLARAVYPLSEQDAQVRLNENARSVERQGIPALEQFELAVAGMRAVVTKPTAKGATSTAVTKRLPAAMRRECRPCKASHISDSAMRAAALAAGLELEPGTSPPVLLRRKGGKVARSVDRTRLTTLAEAYLRLLGPATAGEVAGYLGARRADVVEVLSDRSDDLVEVSVDDTLAYLPADAVDALRKPPPPELVRLLGPFDPYLQARDRALIVPDKSVYKTLWPTLGRPGVLYVDGEVVGAWRSKASGKRATITIETFGALAKRTWQLVEREAERTARARGAESMTLKRAD